MTDTANVGKETDSLAKRDIAAEPCLAGTTETSTDRLGAPVSVSLSLGTTSVPSRLGNYPPEAHHWRYVIFRTTTSDSLLLSL